MTDELIIKGLECLAGEKEVLCAECEYRHFGGYTCHKANAKDALARFKELTEEIKDLEADYDRVYEQAEADIHGNMADSGTSCHWCMDKTKRDTVNRMQKMLKNYLKEVADGDIDTGWIDMIAEQLLEENK